MEMPTRLGEEGGEEGLPEDEGTLGGSGLNSMTAGCATPTELSQLQQRPPNVLEVPRETDPTYSALGFCSPTPTSSSQHSPGVSCKTPAPAWHGGGQL